MSEHERSPLIQAGAGLDDARGKETASVATGADSSKPSPGLFLAVALLSAAVLGFEVSLSRVFAVLLRYQFAFLIVSLALCGLGLGGLVAHKKRNLSLANVAIVWGLAVILSLLLILRGVFAFVPDNYWIAALLVLVPFGVAGTFLSLVFERHSSWGGRLYAYDLAGAALAAGGSVALMQGMGAVNACLVFAALGTFAAVFLTEKKAFPTIFGFVLLALVPYNSRFKLWSVQPIPPKPIMVDPTTKPPRMADLADRGITQPLFTELGAPETKPPTPRSKIVDTRWNAFARTDVVEDPVAPNSYLLYTNGNVPTNMLPWNGKLYELPRLLRQFPLSNWAFQNANIRDKNVLSIGPGGGLDALLALRHGAARFDGAEINPSIVSLMNEPKYRDFNGGIYQHPKVHVVTAEGRAFVRDAKAHGEKYQLIFSALTKTATAGQGAALLESFIYTTDAFNDYMGALDKDGQLIIVGDALPLLARLFTTGLTHFMVQGENQREAGQHIAIVFLPIEGPYQWALVVQKSPISPTQAQQMRSSAAGIDMIPLWIPTAASSDDIYPFGSTASGALALSGFLAKGADPSLPVAIDLSPCPDDRPFVLDLARSPFAIFSSSLSLSVMLGLSVLGTLGFAASLLGTHSTSGEGHAAGAGGMAVLYFLALGVGFMMVEVPLIQKLVLPLGYPTLSLSVILFSILLGGGAGALFSQRFEGERLRSHAMMCAFGVSMLAVLIGATSGALSNILLPLSLTVRCLLASLLLLPLGFLIGTPFPSGMRIFAGRQTGDVPLIWALNGTASVVGSLLAAVVAKMYGFSMVLSLGAVIYACAALLLFVTSKPKS